MKHIKFNQLWATRLMLGIAIVLAFGAGYGFRAQVNESGRWLPPSQRLSSYLSLDKTRNNPFFASTAAADQVSPHSNKANSRPYELLNEVRRNIKENFYRQDVTEKQLTYGAIRGMLASLDDRFTRFMTPEDYQQFQVKNEGEFVGIGVSISTIDEYIGNPAAHLLPTSRPLIVKLIEGGPAQKAGFRKDDVLINVDGHDTANLSLDTVVSYIKGKSGTSLNITVERKIAPANSADKPTFKKINLTVVRDLIEVHPVHLTWLPKDIAWLQLDEFNKRSDNEMTKALKTIKNSSAKGLIIDMRNNPGGLLDSVVAIASNFVKTGPIVFTRERNGEMRAMNAQKNRYLNLQIPIVVLVNNYSASAAEILTGALKDNNLATVVGEHTYGKASVQVLLDLSDGGALAITTAHYLTPDKHDISKKGIAPDVVVKASDADNSNGRGDQLHKAMAIIANTK